MPAQEAMTNFHQAVELFNQGYWAQAVPLLESCVTTVERVYGPESAELAECLQYLGDAYANEERNNQALAVYFRLFNVGERILGRNHPQIVSILWKMSILYERLAQPQDAYQVINEALSAARNCLRADDPLSQQVIDRHRYLNGLLRQLELAKQMGTSASQVLSQPDNSQPMPDYYQSQSNMSQQNFAQLEHSQASGNYASEMPPQIPQQKPQGYIETPQSQSLQDLARSSLAELSQFSSPTAVPRVPFSNSVHNEGLEDSGHFGQTKALDPSVIERNRQVPPNPLTSSTVLGQRPQSVEDSGIYTIEEIEALTGRRTAKVTHGDSKTHRLTTGDNVRIFFGRFGKRVILPAVGGIVIIALTIMALWPMLTGNKPEKGKPVITQTDGSGKGGKQASALSAGPASEIFESGDGKNQVRLLDAQSAIIATETSALQLPCERIGNNWGDYIRAACSSLTEKQIWLSRTKSGLVAENGEQYYGIKEQERRVIEKMRYLAGFAQGVFLRTGEYPKFVPLGCGSEFSFINPFSGKSQTITIKRVPTANNDAADVKLALESGIMVSNEIATDPGYISCYAACLGDSDYDRQRCVKFFVRGLDRNAKFIGTSKPNQALVVQADNKWLEFKPLFRDMDDYEKEEEANQQKQSTKTPLKSNRGKKAKLPAAKSLKVATGSIKAEDELISRLRLEKPSKPTRIWLLEEPGFPVAVVHYLIAIVLLVSTIACFGRSQMTLVDLKGKTISEGSNIALVLALISFVLFFATMVFQFSIFR